MADFPEGYFDLTQPPPVQAMNNFTGGAEEPVSPYDPNVAQVAPITVTGTPEPLEVGAQEPVSSLPTPQAAGPLTGATGPDPSILTNPTPTPTGTSGGGGGGSGATNSVMDWLGQALGGGAGGGLMNTILGAIPGIAEYFRQNKLADKYEDYETDEKYRDMFDPFGNLRPGFQEKLKALYADPSYIENLPGYKFQRDQALNAIDRRAGSNRTFLDSEYPQWLQDRAAKVAESAYRDERDSLLKSSGQDITPQGYQNWLMNSLNQQQNANNMAALALAFALSNRGTVGAGAQDPRQGGGQGGAGSAAGQAAASVLNRLPGLPAAGFTGGPSGTGSLSNDASNIQINPNTGQATVTSGYEGATGVLDPGASGSIDTYEYPYTPLVTDNSGGYIDFDQFNTDPYLGMFPDLT